MEHLRSLPHLLKVRHLRSVAMVIGCVLVLLVLRWWLMEKVSLNSAVLCKNKVAEMVIPNESERGQYLGDLAADGFGLENEYFSFVTSHTMQCDDQVHLGPSEDGGWEVCLMRPYEIKAPCLVYSFGVDFDFRFEKGIEELLGCEVHAFDPSMGEKSHQYSPKGYFHNIGVDMTDTYAALGMWKLRRLRTIMDDLGHEGKTIDYLKMDVEFSEWPALYDMIRTGMMANIRQLGLEVHTAEVDIHLKPDHPCTRTNKQTMAFMLRTLRGLRNRGFMTFYSRTNYRTMYKSEITDHNRYCCHNLHMINTKHEDNQRKEKKQVKKF